MLFLTCDFGWYSRRQLVWDCIRCLFLLWDIAVWQKYKHAQPYMFCVEWKRKLSPMAWNNEVGLFIHYIKLKVLKTNPKIFWYSYLCENQTIFRFILRTFWYVHVSVSVFLRDIWWFKDHFSVVSISRCTCNKLKSKILAYSDFAWESYTQLHLLQN